MMAGSDTPVYRAPHLVLTELETEGRLAEKGRGARPQFSTPGAGENVLTSRQVLTAEAAWPRSA